MTGHRYVLRPRDRDEIGRLEHQHETWREVTDAILDRAGLAPGHRVADLGCGPGLLALDLARRVAPGGSVLGIDNSATFIAHLHERARATGLEVDGVVADLASYEFEENSLDGAFVRWVLMFLASVETLIQGVAHALRPGGVFVAMEYGDFGAMALFPDGPAFRRLYDAVHHLIAGAGGDPDIGARIPALLARNGFDIVDVVPVLRVGRPGTPLWDWLELLNANHANVVDAALLSTDELQAYHDELDAHAERPGAFFTTPLALATIARKR